LERTSTIQSEDTNEKSEDETNVDSEENKE
jgi:hypothetical protein